MSEQLIKDELVLSRSIHYMLNSLHLNTKKLTSVWSHSGFNEINNFVVMRLIDLLNPIVFSPAFMSIFLV